MGVLQRRRTETVPQKWVPCARVFNPCLEVLSEELRGLQNQSYAEHRQHGLKTCAIGMQISYPCPSVYPCSFSFRTNGNDARTAVALMDHEPIVT
jgi:hypothetical protein